MQRKSLWLAFSALALAAWAGPADAVTHPITCDNSTPGQLNTLLTGGSVNPGDTIEITNICVGDVFVQPGLTLTNDSNSSSLVAADGVQGMVTTAGSANGTTVINGITLEGTGTDNGDAANLAVANGAAVNLQNAEVKNAQRDGILVNFGGSLTLMNTKIDGNGVANKSQKNNGIRVKSQGVINDMIGTNSVIQGNAGFGIQAQGAYIELSNTDFTSNTTSEIYALNSYLNLGGGTITASGNLPAIQAISASSATMFGTTIFGPAGAIVAAGASSVITAQSTISTANATIPAIEATGTSSLILAGGDTITNSATGGPAIQVDHLSSLVQQQASKLKPGTPQAVETINGGGSIQMQSSLDLGLGLVSSNPSVTWTLSGTEIINIQQNSSFRMSGGATVSGGNGVKVQQGSNAFFNTNNGGVNSATTTCVNSANNPMTHVSNPGSVSPAVTDFNLNDLLTGVSGAAHPGQTNSCLNF
jgi:hypothetical protein